MGLISVRKYLIRFGWLQPYGDFKFALSGITFFPKFGIAINKSDLRLPNALIRYKSIYKVGCFVTDVQVVLVVSNRVGVSIVAAVWSGLWGRPHSFGAAAAAACVRSNRALQQRLHAAHIRHACLCARVKSSPRAVHWQIKPKFVTKSKTSLN